MRVMEITTEELGELVATSIEAADEAERRRRAEEDTGVDDAWVDDACVEDACVEEVGRE